MPYEMNYLNPAAFMPKNNFAADGATGALMHHRQDEDYRKIMEVQHFLQQLGAQQAAQKQKEFMEGAPVRALERNVKREELEGQLPYAREAAGSILQGKAAEADYNRKTTHSPEAIEQYFRDMKNKGDDRKWEMTKRELTIGGNLAHQAIQLAETQGEAAAMAFVQQHIKKAKEMGVDLPEKQFMDPQGWRGVVNAARYSIEQMQKIDQIAVKGNYDLAEADKRGRYAVEAAGVRASAAGQGAGRMPNIAQRKVQLRSAIASGRLSPEDMTAAKEELTGYVMDDFQNQISRDPQLRSLADTAALGLGARSERAREQYESIYQSRLRDYLQRHGLADKPRTPNIKEVVEAAGEKYNPQTYEYRVTPDGKVQRKKK